ncbi:MAG TPA: right-handed parallel beta-helix repeat-containing protein [Verrucomicrobiae bacterium]|nr:right-handed parallel beta-helix repeat-containing protein [Verrucomicrobiae bacterium]
MMKVRILLGVLLSSHVLLAQGPLVPPGPPTPMMKTLEQIEPRRPISALPVTISQAGSYYLTTNLTGVAGQHGITINGPRVTLDLMGFELRGVPGSLSGIFLNPATSPHIRNGNITGWGQDGINGNNGGSGVIEELRVSGNTRYGLSFNSGSQIRKCIVFGNGDVGILLSNDVEVDDCVASGNGTHGIQAGTGSTIRRCLAVANIAAGITGSGLDGLNIIECNTDFNTSGIATLGQTIVKDSFARSNKVAGIAVGPASLVTGCNGSDNGTNGISVDLGSTVQGCITENNKGHGIVARNGTSVINCSARINGADNIQVDGDCIVANNSVDNATALNGVGIHALTGDNRIENNNVTDNRTGLRIDAAGNYVANNTVRNNTTNYVIVQGNQLNILLSQLPMYVPWPATIKLAGTLTGIRNTNGITIVSDDVTIDLNDHALIGVVQALDGVRVEGIRTNITVRNGSVLGWPGDGVDAASAVNSQLRNLNAARNLARGLAVGTGSLIASCTARTNSTDGIWAGLGCRVIDCTTSQNGSEGFFLNGGSTIEGCTALDNTANGIFAGAGSSVVNCTAYSNGTNGISVLESRVVGCVARVNAGNGIQAATRCTIENNNCIINSFAGILVTSSGSRVDSNHASGGQRGFLVTGVDNLIIRNSAQAASVLNYDIAAGNHDAARITNPGANFASSSPWANFSF